MPLFPGRGVDAGIDAFQSSGDEYESGDLDSSSDGFSWQEGHARSIDAWVSPGRDDLTERLLFAFIEPSVPVGEPEETSSRFFRVPTWLAFVFIVDFPNEHWYESKIKECFLGFCEVAEIDPACLTGNNFAPLRLLLEVNDRLEIPFEIKISKRGLGRAGCVAKILPIRVWPRAYQLDSQGNLASFFGPPPPPGHGPNLGPSGPFNRKQQVRPQPHHFNQIYPPNQLPPDLLGEPNNSDYYPSDLLAPPTASLSQPPASPPASQILGLALAFARVLVTPPSSSTASGCVSLSSPSSATESLSDDSVLAAELPLAPPPSLASTPSPPVITYRRTRARSAMPTAPKRHSSRLAAKAPANFVDMTTQVVQRKALLNSLSGCSASLKKHVAKKNILSRNKLPIGVSDLHKPVSAAGLGCKDIDIVDAVTNSAE
ncbi:uncharacterized protein [Miscanthus floridulus]|uniref:uncharacterized protein n=1 Tax=Miscanthus floridulus TaxID=154761 RepID=UPI003459D91C